MTEPKNTWDFHAKIYKYFWAVVEKSGRNTVVEYLNQYCGMKILEVGVGIGFDISKYHSSHQLYLTDLNQSMLEVCKKNAQDLPNIQKIEIMDVTNIKYPDNEFDIVIATHLLSTVPDAQKALNEMSRVLKKGGQIIVLNQEFSSRKWTNILPCKYINKITLNLGWKFMFSILPLLEEAQVEISVRKPIFPCFDFMVLQKIGSNNELAMSA